MYLSCQSKADQYLVSIVPELNWYIVVSGPHLRRWTLQGAWRSSVYNGRRDRCGHLSILKINCLLCLKRVSTDYTLVPKLANGHITFSSSFNEFIPPTEGIEQNRCLFILGLTTLVLSQNGPKVVHSIPKWPSSPMSRSYMYWHPYMYRTSKSTARCRDLDWRGLYMTQRRSLVVSQSIHGSLCDVEPDCSVVHSRDWKKLE